MGRREGGGPATSDDLIEEKQRYFIELGLSSGKTTQLWHHQ